MIEWIASSTVLTAAVIALRFFLRGRVGPRLQYALWGLVLLRLLIPVSFGSAGLSVSNLAQRAAEATAARSVSELAQSALPRMSYGAAYSEVEKEYAARGVDISDLSAGDREAFDRAVRSRVDSGWTARDILRVLWLSGAAVVGLTLVVSNACFAARLRRTRHRLNGVDCPLSVYLSAAAETPCLSGLLRPAVYVTPDAAESADALRCITAHELTHFRHGDHVWSLLRAVCLALHWYNPLVWWAAALSRRDSELACDEAAIKRLGESERAEYGRTLIAMTCRGHPEPLRLATTMTGSKNDMKERITFMVKRPKTTRCALAAVLLFAVAITGCTFTGGEGLGHADDSEIYEDRELGFSIEFPSTWKDNYTIEVNPQSSSGVVVQTSWGGILCYIFRETSEEWEESGKGESIPVEYRVLGENSDYVYLLYFASDVNYDPEDEEQVDTYNEMREDLYDVKFAILENVNQNSETLIGFISIQDGKVTLDEVEIITEEDTDRIEELGLTYQGDLINGYYIYNEEESTCTLSLTDKTKYIFTDSGQLYLTLEEDKDLIYETTSLEEFMKGSCYASSAIANAQSDIPTGRIPYFVEVLGDEVISITEEFCYTM